MTRTIKKLKPSGIVSQEIKLIRIYKNTMDDLSEASARLDIGDSRRDVYRRQIKQVQKQIAEQEEIMNRKRQILLENYAQSGYNTDPVVRMELKDIGEYIERKAILIGSD